MRMQFSRKIISIKNVLIGISQFELCELYALIAKNTKLWQRTQSVRKRAINSFSWKWVKHRSFIYCEATSLFTLKKNGFQYKNSRQPKFNLMNDDSDRERAKRKITFGWIEVSWIKASSQYGLQLTRIEKNEKLRNSECAC